MTSSAPAICGTRLGLTKLTASTRGTPAAARRSHSSARTAGASVVVLVLEPVAGPDVADRHPHGAARAYCGAELHATGSRDALISAHPALVGYAKWRTARHRSRTPSAPATSCARRSSPASLPPGARLRAEPLAERLQTSRTPVREALILLAREGLVDIEPRRGAVVRQFDAADLADLYDVRALIEPYAARRAATRIGAAGVARLAELCDRADARGAADDAAVEDQVALNEEFHRIIVAAAESPRLEAALRAVAGIPRAFRAAFWHDDAQREQSLFCHRQIVHALEHRQPRLAEAACGCTSSGRSSSSRR